MPVLLLMQSVSASTQGNGHHAVRNLNGNLTTVCAGMFRRRKSGTTLFLSLSLLLNCCQEKSVHQISLVCQTVNAARRACICMSKLALV